MERGRRKGKKGREGREEEMRGGMDCEERFEEETCW